MCAARGRTSLDLELTATWVNSDSIQYANPIGKDRSKAKGMAESNGVSALRECPWTCQKEKKFADQV